MRRPHLLRHNKGSRLPSLLMAFDTETDSVPIADDAVEAKLRFGWIAITRRHRGLHWTPEKWSRFETPSELWDIVEAAIHDEWRGMLTAHNVGFDFRVVDGFRQLPDRGWTLKGAVVDDPPTILRWHKPSKGLIVLDTVNYYRARLADIGATFGLAKLDHDLKWGDREKDDAYCRRDVEIVLRAMRGIIRRTHELDLGNFAPTFPGLAFGAFRHRHMSTQILIDDNTRALDLARQSYYGGRTEAFFLGRVAGTVEVYDVASMYPAVMRDTPMPTVLRGVYRSMTLADLAAPATDTSSVANVTLNTDQADYPIIYNGRLVFPVGTFRTVLPQPELTHAVEHGRVVKVHKVAVYDAAVIFRSFVEEWWQRRLEAIDKGDASEADFCKRMMNSLYGKFGQTGKVYETIGQIDSGEVRTWTEIDLETGEVSKMRSISGLVQKLARETESRDSHPAIAATVTSEARVRLLKLMIGAGRDGVLYVDTDSLFLAKGVCASRSELPIGNGLGDLKHERTIHDLTIHGLKDYTADGIRKTKGVRANAEEIQPGTFRQDTFVGLKGAIRSGDINRQVIRRTTKVLTRGYDKGTVLASGVVVPYRLGGGD